MHAPAAADLSGAADLLGGGMQGGQAAATAGKGRWRAKGPAAVRAVRWQPPGTQGQEDDPDTATLVLILLEARWVLPAAVL